MEGTPGSGERGRSEGQPVPAGGFMAGGCAPAAPPSTWSASRCLSCRGRPPPPAQGPQQPGLRCPPPARPLNAGRARAPKDRAHARPSSAHIARRCFGRLTPSTHALEPSLSVIGSGGEGGGTFGEAREGRFHGNHTQLAPRILCTCGSFCLDFSAWASSSRINLCLPPFYFYNCIGLILQVFSRT